MDEFSAPIGLFVFVGLVGFLLLYITARQRTKDYTRGKRKFNALSGNLVELRDRVATESDRWPIYARPVMFEDIDHDTQIEFAKAQQALTDADQILPLIERSPEPETPEQFHFGYLFNIPKNIRTISIGNQLIGNVSSFEQYIANLKGFVKSVRDNRHKVENKRLGVEISIRVLKHRIELTNLRIRSADLWNLIEAHNISWVVNIADRCHLEAQARVTKTTDDEQGYLEHAIAGIFVEVGNFALDCIDLFVESQEVSRRYELDVFSKLLGEATDFLESIIAMEEDINGWRKLKRAKGYIDRFPETKLLAESSLLVFKQHQHNLEKLIKSINEVFLADEVEKVNSLEKECIYYWYSYEERKNNWEKVLGVPPRFPSVELNRFQTLLATDVLPPVGVDMIIKQSQVLVLIRKISQALEWHDFLNTIIAQLAAELDFHKKAQKIVDSLLDHRGKATVMLAEVKLALGDTSPDLSDLGSKLVNDHQNYVARANKVRGANFPELQSNVEQFIFQSESLIDQHNLQLINLMGEYRTFYEKIELSIKEIDKYINHTPRFDNQTIRLLSAAYKAGWVMLQQSATEKYSWLRTITNEMRTWVQNAGSFIHQIREKHQAFMTGRLQVEYQFRKTKEQIQAQRLLIERKWGWYRNEITPPVDQAEQSLDLEINEWKRLEERNWVELTIYKGVARCEQLAKFSEEILNDLNQQIGKVNQKQIALNNKVSDINSLLLNNSNKLSQEAQQEIRKLLILAKQAQHYDTAKQYLEYAASLALKRATWRERDVIKKIININSDGGPVFMDTVDNRRGKISGRRDKKGKN